MVLEYMLTLCAGKIKCAARYNVYVNRKIVTLLFFDEASTGMSLPHFKKKKQKRINEYCR